MMQSKPAVHVYYKYCQARPIRLGIFDRKTLPSSMLALGLLQYTTSSRRYNITGLNRHLTMMAKGPFLLARARH